MSRNWTEAEWQDFLRKSSQSPAPEIIPGPTNSKLKRVYQSPDREEWAKATAVHTRRQPNKWEKRYAEEFLEPARLIGDILWYGFEAIRIRLATGAYYTPDFAVITPKEAYMVEVKGFWREAARVRIKVAAEAIPIRFYAVTRDKRTGAWIHELFFSPAKQ